MIEDNNEEKLNMIKIGDENISTYDKQKYFNLCGSKRRFPGGNDIFGVIISCIFFVLLTFLFIFINISLYYIKLLDNSNNTKFLIFAIVAIITFFIAIGSFFDVVTSLPGYQKGERLTPRQFAALSPTVTIKEVTFIKKYCETCELIRDVRTFHCDVCGRCVERHDHHCGFVSNCIGKENLKNFFIFLIILFIHSGYIESVSLYIITNLVKKSNIQANYRYLTLFTGGLLALVGLFCAFSVSMIIQHSILISKNQTTNEEIRRKYNYAVFDNGIKENWREVCSKDSFI